MTNAWRLAVGSDLSMPGVEGPRPLSMRASNWYVARVLGAAERDPEVARRFLRVAGLVDPPTALFSPSVVGRVLGAALRPAGARATGVAAEAAVVG